jgi:type III pantothenate kinase
MLLVVDIGNTNIGFGIFKERRLLKKFTIPTKEYTFEKLCRHFKRTLPLSDAIICSVVPKQTLSFARDLKKCLGRKPYIIGKNAQVLIKNLYRRPRQVGQDRLVNAYAGLKIYGAPLVIVDFGTAVTFDAVSKHREYLGGMILPGLKISLSTLHEKTALLPKIRLARPPEFIGRDTRRSMLSGIIFGFAGLTDKLAQELRKALGNNTKIIGTGGDINLIYRYCKSIDIIDAELTLKGLRLTYENCLGQGRLKC